MRMGFGLVGILVTLGVMVFIIGKIWAPSVQQDIKIQKDASQELNQISGRDNDTGKRIEDTFKLFADTRSDGKLQDFQVTEVDPGSPMDKFFGLKEDDVILVASDGHGIDWPMNQETDEESARLRVRDAYTTQGHLTVMRGDAKLILPGATPVTDQNGAPVAAAPGQPAAQPTATQAQKPKQPNPGDTDDQMDRLQRLSHMNPGLQ